MRINLLIIALILQLPLSAQVLSVNYGQTITHQDRDRQSHLGQAYDISAWFNLNDHFSLGLSYRFNELSYRQRSLLWDTLITFEMKPGEVHAFGLFARYLLNDPADRNGWELLLGYGGWSHEVLTEHSGFNWFTFQPYAYYTQRSVLSSYVDLGVSYYYAILPELVDFSIDYKLTAVYDHIPKFEQWTDQTLLYSSLQVGVQFVF